MSAYLKCNLKIKNEYLNALKELDGLGYEWKKHSLQIFRSFGEKHISPFVPSYNSLENDTNFNKGFDENSKNWSFQCSFEEYDEEIKFFIYKIVPLIVEEVIHLEFTYEENQRFDLCTNRSFGKILINGSNFQDESWEEKSFLN